MKKVAILLITLILLVAVYPAMSQTTNPWQTSFPLTANPISEGGNWINGLTTGISWGNVQTNGVMAFGTTFTPTCNGGTPTGCRDSIATLTGVWSPDQSAQGTVSQPTFDGTCCEEVELHLRRTITGSSSTGYEITCSVSSTHYLQIVRWNGPLDNFTYVNNGDNTDFCAAGDVITATMIGSTIRVYKNGAIISALTSTDSTYTNGSPGMGFFNSANSSFNHFGFSNFVAANVVALTTAESDVQAAVNLTSPAGGDIVAIPCAGVQSAIWTGTLTGLNNFTLTALGATPNTGIGTFGAGTNCLTIRDNNPSGPVIGLTPGYQAGQVTTVQNLNIDPLTSITPLNYPLSFSGTCTGSGCPEIRVDNVIFGNAVQWTEGGNGSQADSMITLDNVFGVADHNTLPNGSGVVFENASLSAYLGVGSYGDNSWAQPDSFGTRSNFFNENNLVYVGGVSVTDAELSPTGNIGGSRVVNRYNKIFENGAFGTFGFHGLDSGGRNRGGREMENYNNPITCTTNQICNIITGNRAGTSLTFGNTLTNLGTSFWSAMVNISVYRIVQSFAPWNGCGGLNSIDPFDTNDNSVLFSGTMSTSGSGVLTMTDSGKSFGNLVPNGAPYSVYDVTQNFISQVASNTATTITITTAGGAPGAGSFNNGDSYEIIRSTICQDQGGRGQGLLVQNPSPVLQGTGLVGPVNQVSDPIMEWDDSMSPVRMNFNVASGSLGVIANRDYYTDNWYPGSGPVAQTSSSAPFNGTTTCNSGSGNYTCGVGFGTIVFRPTTCNGGGEGYFATDVGSQGTLYACKTTNTWTSIYTPYTYPHPLAGGSLTTITPPPAPSTTSFVWNGTFNKTVPVTLTGTDNISIPMGSFILSGAKAISLAGSVTVSESVSCSCTLANGKCAITCTGK